MLGASREWHQSAEPSRCGANYHGGQKFL